MLEYLYFVVPKPHNPSCLSCSTMSNIHDIQYITSQNLTWPLKIDRWKMKCCFGMAYFQGYVSFKEGILIHVFCQWFILNMAPSSKHWIVHPIIHPNLTVSLLSMLNRRGSTWMSPGCWPTIGRVPSTKVCGQMGRQQHAWLGKAPKKHTFRWKTWPDAKKSQVFCFL